MLNYRNDLKLSVIDGVIAIDETITEPGLSPAFEAMQRHQRHVMDTKDQMVREALIKLGWTPPPEVLHSKRDEPTGA